MPKRYPDEFKRDVVAVARRREVSQETTAHDFGISPTTLKRWVRQADIDDGVTAGATTAEQAEVVKLRRQNRRLQQEVRSSSVPPRTSRRTSTQNDVPAGP